MTYPTLAAFFVQAGEPERAAELITDRTRAAADCDADTAYRLATYHAQAGDIDAALQWMRRAIYLGNENYPWFAANPAWTPIRDNADFEAILVSLRGRYERNVAFWKSLDKGG
jgi:serine/threonine-protein kinase